MVCSSVSVLIGGNLFFLDLYMLRYLATRKLRTARYESHSSRIPTGTERGDFMTSPVTNVHVQTRSPRNSVAIKRMRKQSVPGAFSSPSSAPGNEANYAIALLMLSK